jgi:hypothetical protein
MIVHAQRVFGFVENSVRDNNTLFDAACIGLPRAREWSDSTTKIEIMKISNEMVNINRGKHATCGARARREPRRCVK